MISQPHRTTNQYSDLFMQDSHNWLKKKPTFIETEASHNDDPVLDNSVQLYNTIILLVSKTGFLETG